jgi:hypothetical protein
MLVFVAHAINCGTNCGAFRYAGGPMNSSGKRAVSWEVSEMFSLAKASISAAAH